MESLFFIVAKLFWIAIQPLALVLVFLIVALLALAIGRRRTATIVLIAAISLFYVAGWTNLGTMLTAGLENRFPAAPDPGSGSVAAIIVLGGGFEGDVTAARGGYALGQSGDRFAEAAMLARRFPQAKIIISGGDGSLGGGFEADAVIAPRFFTRLGVPRSRLVLETRSRDTFENAVFTKPLIEGLEEDGSVLLVTSAFHMPRAMAVFVKAGMIVTPWPVDFRTPGDTGFRPFDARPDVNLSLITLAVREHVGLLAYRLTGRL